jgi:hypothetical protein
MQPLFLRWYNLNKRFEYHQRFWAIQLNSCKNFKNQVRRWMSKRQVEFVKDDVINHIVTRTSSKRQMIENVWQNTDIARSKKRVNLSIILLWSFVILHFCFGITSHPLTKHIFPLSLCCSESMRCLFQWVFWQIFLIKLQHVKLRLINLERLKVFWLQKWLDACWNDMRCLFFLSATPFCCGVSTQELMWRMPWFR